MVERIPTGEIVRICGRECEVVKWRWEGEKCRFRTAYRFTVPGWEECEITGRAAAKRVIAGRTSAAVKNTLRLV